MEKMRKPDLVPDIKGEDITNPLFDVRLKQSSYLLRHTVDIFVRSEPAETAKSRAELDVDIDSALNENSVIAEPTN